MTTATPLPAPTQKETLDGIVATNLLRMFTYHRPSTVYMVNSELGQDQLVGEKILKVVTDKVNATIAHSLAAAAGGTPTTLYLDIDVGLFQPYVDEAGIYIHLERSASRLAALLARQHSRINYTGLIVTLGAAPYRRELFDLNPAEAMLHLTRGLNNHLPHQCVEMAGHYVVASEASRLSVAFAPIHSMSFVLDQHATSKPQHQLQLPSWQTLSGEVELVELMAEQLQRLDEAEVLVESQPVEVEPAPVEQPDVPAEPEPAATALEQEAAAAVAAMAPVTDVLDDIMIGSALLSAGGSLRADDSIISYVTFPMAVAGQFKRAGFCQNGTFTAQEAQGPHAAGITLMLGNQLAIDLVEDAPDLFQPDELLYLQGQLDRHALMNYYFDAVQSLSGEDLSTITHYFGGIEQLREQLEKFFEVLPSKLN